MKNWQQLVPPNRPSPHQLSYLETITKNLDHEIPVAVLGSTVEFRDLLFELGFENIYVFERNKSFYDQMSAERIYQNAETLILGDWVETLPAQTNKFCLIVSDLTSGNVPYENRKHFYSSIEGALQTNGHFYDKVLTHESFLGFEMLLKKYERLPVNNVSVNYFSCELLFCSELLIDHELVETTRLYGIIERASQNKRIGRFVELSKIITPENFVWYYGKRWAELVTAYCSGLTKLNELADFTDSPFFERAKIFHFVKASN